MPVAFPYNTKARDKDATASEITEENKGIFRLYERLLSEKEAHTYQTLERTVSSCPSWL